jgi:hypothetical protein
MGSINLNRLSILLWVIAFVIPASILLIDYFGSAYLRGDLGEVLNSFLAVALFYLPIAFFMHYLGRDVFRYPPRYLSPEAAFGLLCLPSTVIIYISVFKLKEGPLAPIMNWLYGLPLLLVIYFVFMKSRKRA